MRCQSCEVMYVNGVRCHERGCPDTWRDEIRECEECGGDFEPEERGQMFCGSECAAAYLGLPCGEE